MAKEMLAKVKGYNNVILSMFGREQGDRLLVTHPYHALLLYRCLSLDDFINLNVKIKDFGSAEAAYNLLKARYGDETVYWRSPEPTI